MRRSLIRVLKKILLSLLVLAIPLLYVGVCMLRQHRLPHDKPPFVHWSGLDPHSEVMVTWETSRETGSFIQYGTTPAGLSVCLDDHTPVTLHRFHLKDLSSNTRYYYRAGSASSQDRGSLCEVRSFKTAPWPHEVTEFKATFISDTQQVLGMGHYNTVASAIHRHLETDFLANAGDFVDVAENQRHWNQFFWESKYLDHIPLVPCPGNHESIDSPGSGYVKYFGFTENNRDVYYSFDWGNTQFVVAQIGSRGHVDPNDPRNAIPYQWLNETLAAGQDKDYRILIYHIHRADVIAPIVEKYNVSLAIHGHAHSYERYVLNGHTYICLGNGATLQAGSVKEDPKVQKRTNGAGFTRLTIRPEWIRVETFAPTLSVMDEVCLFRDASSGRLIPEEPICPDRRNKTCGP